MHNAPTRTIGPLTGIGKSILNVRGKSLQFRLHPLIPNDHNLEKKKPFRSSSNEVIYLSCSLGVHSSQSVGEILIPLNVKAPVFQGRDFKIT